MSLNLILAIALARLDQIELNHQQKSERHKFHKDLAAEYPDLFARDELVTKQTDCAANAASTQANRQTNR